MMNKNNQIMYSVMPWIASIAFFMQTLDASILITSLPKMADSLNESPLNLETAVICYSLTLAIFIPVSGFVSDRFGTRNIFIFFLRYFFAGLFLQCCFSFVILARCFKSDPGHRRCDDGTCISFGLIENFR
ncbi:MFS transporter [Salmonella enterica]|nr:MFS transporter [Salmonella enterica subsp. enterica serovar Infantis]HCL2047211.1 MFS transporter [Salmonella enterica subsp. enterica serovar Infantis]HCL2494910.1 MFS transporter [Salmonella enterica subsp. enterica serovar Infantis]